MFRSPAVLALALSLCLLGCDAFGGGSRVQGRIVDSATGAPVDPGEAVVSVYGQEGFLSAAPLLVQGEADADGAFSFSGLSESPSRVTFGASGRISYPGRDSTGLLANNDPFRYAYFPLRTAAPRAR